MPHISGTLIPSPISINLKPSRELQSDSVLMTSRFSSVTAMLTLLNCSTYFTIKKNQSQTYNDVQNYQ